MVSVTTDQPHDIEAGPYTGSYAHFFASKIQPTCDDAILAVGSTFRTNQSLFEYQVASSEDAGPPALTYHNEPIDNCHAYHVMLDFSTWYGRPANQINISAWGLGVTVDLKCFVKFYSHSVDKEFSLQVQIDPIKDAFTNQTIPKPTWMISPTAGHASKWAQVLMLVFWKETIAAMMNQTATVKESENAVPQHNLTHGYVQLDRRSGRWGSMQDDHYFEKASWVFFDAAKNERYVGSIGALNETDYPDLNIESYAHSSTWPLIWSPVDRLAKAVLSAVYVELGLHSEPQTSMVSDADTLRYWSANLSTIAEQNPIYLGISNMGADVNVTNYDAQQQLPIGSEYQLGTLPDLAGDGSSRAVINTTYVCQQPQIKPPFNVFISILVADLVFLQTAWSLYNLVVGYFLKSRHPDANICDECLARKTADEVVKQEGEDGTAHGDKMPGVGEHTIELDYLGPPSPSARRDDQSSAQSLLTHRHV
ncbi:hypothetical protein KCV07_g8224, partial [Aureobasidium melanogenum]